MSELRRRQFITLLGGAAAWPLAAPACNRRESYRLLDFWARMLWPSVHGRLLSSHTYANGLDREPNVGIEYRWTEGRTER